MSRRRWVRVGRVRERRYTTTLSGGVCGGFDLEWVGRPRWGYPETALTWEQVMDYVHCRLRHARLRGVRVGCGVTRTSDGWIVMMAEVERTMEPLKKKWPRAQALDVARELCAVLKPVCERLVVAGSLRRGWDLVGDVEVVFIGKREERVNPGDMFAKQTVNLAEEAIARMEDERVLGRRKSKVGTEAFGPKNKLMVHLGTGMPVDLFSTTEEAWWNYLVCRTGPAESNTRIASAAQRMGWKWNPYGAGFSREVGAGTEVRRMGSEKEVFEFVGLEYREAGERV